MGQVKVVSQKSFSMALRSLFGIEESTLADDKMEEGTYSLIFVGVTLGIIVLLSSLRSKSLHSPLSEMKRKK
jgi:hypothetical protein